MESTSQNQLFTAYWTGYQKSINTLDTTPSGVDQVILAFFGPLDNKVEITFITSIYSAEQLKSWIKVVKKKGIKVIASLLDTPQTHWNTVDMEQFSKSLSTLIEEWGFDGIDIDAESGMPSSQYVSSFISLIKTCRSLLPEGATLSYTCYLGLESYDGEILKETIDLIDTVQLMAYGDDFDSMVALFNNYNQIVPAEKLIIGVKAGTTPLQEVVKLTEWNSAKKGGMMLWNLPLDTIRYSNKPRWSYFQAILNNIKRGDKNHYNNVRRTWWFV